MAQYPSSSELDKITQTSNFLVGKYLDDVNGIVTNVTADGTVVLTYRLNAYTINFMNALLRWFHHRQLRYSLLRPRHHHLKAC